MTNPPKCRGTEQHCNESSLPSWLETSSSDFPKQTPDDHHRVGKWPRSRRLSLPSSNVARRAAPTSYSNQGPIPNDRQPHPQQQPTDKGQSALCYRCRATSPTQQLRLHVTGFGPARQECQEVEGDHRR